MPPTLPRELMMETEHAASAPAPAHTAGHEKKGPYVQKAPEVAAQSRRRATAVEPRAASGARPREMPQTSSGSAQCQRRSEVRFECHAFVSIAALAHLVRVRVRVRVRP